MSDSDSGSLAPPVSPQGADGLATPVPPAGAAAVDEDAHNMLLGQRGADGADGRDGEGSGDGAAHRVLNSVVIDAAADHDPFPKQLQGDHWLCKNCGVEHSGLTLTCKCGSARLCAGVWLVGQVYVPAKEKRHRATWVTGTEATKCESCPTEFSLVEGRHHCRECGKVFCGACSKPARQPCRGYGMSLQRTCNGCYLKFARGQVVVRIGVNRSRANHRTLVTLVYFHIRLFLSDSGWIHLIVDDSEAPQRASVSLVAAVPRDGPAERVEQVRAGCSTDKYEDFTDMFEKVMRIEMARHSIAVVPLSLPPCGSRERFAVRVAFSAAAEDELAAAEMALCAGLLTGGLKVEFADILMAPERVEFGGCPNRSCNDVLWWPVKGSQPKRCRKCATDRPSGVGWLGAWTGQQAGWTPLGPTLAVQIKENGGRWEVFGHSDSMSCAHLMQIYRRLLEKAETLRDSVRCVVVSPGPQVSPRANDAEIATLQDLLRKTREELRATQEQLRTPPDAQLQEERDELLRVADAKSARVAELLEETRRMQDDYHRKACRMEEVHRNVTARLQNQIDDYAVMLQDAQRSARQQSVQQPPAQPEQPPAQPEQPPAQPEQPPAQQPPVQPQQPLAQQPPMQPQQPMRYPSPPRDRCL